MLEKEGRLTHILNAENKTKRCCTCREEKLFSEFYMNKNNGDGKEKRCNDCQRDCKQKKRAAWDPKNIDIPDEKHCPQCKTTRPKEEFWTNKNRKDGLNNICTPCAKVDVQKKKTQPKTVQKYKKCSKCKETKETEKDFYKCQTNSDGREGVCKVCTEAKTKERREEKKGSRECKKCGVIKLDDQYAPSTSGRSGTCNACMGVGEGEKRCSKCKESLPYDSFTRRKTSKDGYLGRCRDCVKANNERAAKEKEEEKEESSDEDFVVDFLVASN
jgi:hypothetical protein